MSEITALLSKVTLLLLLGAALARALRSRSAATRHFIWALTLFSTIAVAIVANVAPPMEVEVPVNRAVTVEAPSHPEPGVVASLPGAPQPKGILPSAGNDTKLLPLLYLTGLVLVLAWNVLGHIGLTRIARSATPLSDDWRALAPEAMNVRLGMSASISAPVTWGWRRPTILFPDAAGSWPLDRRRAALLHELAHVARRDYLVQVMASAICAIYWFHPLVWLALRRLRRESEHASDDQVLSRGAEAPEYASHLLAVAAGAGARRLIDVPSLGMSRPSELENRLLAVLDETRTRSVASGRARGIAAALVVLLLVPLAAARPQLRDLAINVVTRSKAEKPEPAREIDHTDTVVTRNKVAEKSEPSAWDIDRTVHAAPGEVLRLDLETGASVDIRSWDEPRVRVQGRIRGLSAADAIVDVERAAGGVRVHARYGRKTSRQSSSIDLDVRVPRRFDVLLDSSGGGLAVSDVEGSFTGRTGGGPLTFTNVKGYADLVTGGGEIDVTDCRLEGKMTTGGGAVTITRVDGGFRTHTGSGSVIRRGDAERDGGTDRLSLRKAGGDIHLDEAPHGAVVSTGGGEIRIGRAAGVIEASTGGGNVTIGPVAGSVYAGTGAGNVEITLVESGDEQNVHVITGSGRVMLELPANLDARFELETAYTNNFHRPTQIDSDWSLTQSASMHWDDREGTPRRYVRATGTAGNGRGLIRVRVVNGDIFVRQGE